MKIKDMNKVIDSRLKNKSLVELDVEKNECKKALKTSALGVLISTFAALAGTEYFMLANKNFDEEITKALIFALGGTLMIGGSAGLLGINYMNSVYYIKKHNKLKKYCDSLSSPATMVDASNEFLDLKGKYYDASEEIIKAKLIKVEK